MYEEMIGWTQKQVLFNFRDRGPLSPNAISATSTILRNTHAHVSAEVPLPFLRTGNPLLAF